MNVPSQKNHTGKTVLILGANSDVAKEAIKLYNAKGYFVIAASRSTDALNKFLLYQGLTPKDVQVQYFDASAFDDHLTFYNNLPFKPTIVVYAAGYLKDNRQALLDWEASYRMMTVNYCGAVSILNIIASDIENINLERIIGLSSLSGVRGRKSNFIYGSTKAAFTQYLAGLRQHLFSRNIIVNVIIAGYIKTKMNAGLELEQSLMLEPSFVASAVVEPANRFVVVPGMKWKIIYRVLTLLPEKLVARLP